MATIEQAPVSKSMEIQCPAPSVNQTRPKNSNSIKKTPPKPLQTYKGTQFSCEDGKKDSGPESFKAPKAFNFTERYMSPTDRILSPVSKGLLARNRKITGRLPPSVNPPKTLDSSFQDVALC